MDATDLIVKPSYPQSITIKAYTTDSNNEENTISVVHPTIFNNKHAKNFLFRIQLPETFTSQDLYFGVYNSDQELAATFKQYIEVQSASSEDNGSLTSSTCNGETFGNCELKYIFDNVKFETSPTSDAEVKVVTEDNGKYKVVLPLVRTKKIKVETVEVSSSSNSSLSDSSDASSSTSSLSSSSIDVFEFISDGIKKASAGWNDTLKALSFSFGESTNLFSIGESGEVRVGNLEETQNAFLTVRASDSDTASLKLKAGDLTDSPVDGAIEYDGRNFYFTRAGNRSLLNPEGQAGPAGPPGPRGLTGPAGSFSGGDASITGTLTFSGAGKVQNIVSNGTLTINETIIYDEYVNNTSGAAVTVDWTAGNRQEITLDTNVTFTFTDPAGPANLSIFLYQDGTGSRTVTWPASVHWADGSAPTLTNTGGQLDIVTCMYRSSVYYCMSALNFAP